MKRYAFCVLAALIASAGCEVTEPLPDGPPSGQGAFVNLSVQMQYSPTQTRSGQEDTISGGFILEFDSDGTLLESMPFYGGDIPEMQVRKYQQMEIYIVANPTVDLSGISNKEELLSTAAWYSFNQADRLEMTGHFSGTFVNDTTVNVNMERMMSKITLDVIAFRLSSSSKYTGVYLRQIYMERTPSTCRYDYSLPGDFLNADAQGISIGNCPRYTFSVNEYSQGEYHVREYDHPQSLYCFPNESGIRDERNKIAVSYRLVYQVPGYDAITGEPVVITRYDDACVHLVLPPMRPNTVYELERLTVTGARYGTVYLNTRGQEPEETETCLFRMTDLTSGEYLGTAEGEVEYVMLDS